jgi:hypothetical protein
MPESSAPGAYGNDATCKVQGFLFVFGTIGATGYNLALSYYYSLAIVYNYREQQMQSLRKWFHAGPAILPFIFASLGLPFYQPTFLTCYLLPPPAESTWALLVLLDLAPVSLVILLVLVNMVLICRHVWNHSRVAEQWRAGRFPNAKRHDEPSSEVAARTSTNESFHIENSADSFENFIPVTLLDVASETQMLATNSVLDGGAHDDESQPPKTAESAKPDNKLDDSMAAKNSDRCKSENISDDSIPEATVSSRLDTIKSTTASFQLENSIRRSSWVGDISESSAPQDQSSEHSSTTRTSRRLPRAISRTEQEVFWQAFFYVAALMLTWVAYLINYHNKIYETYTVQVSVVLFLPLQGFFNFFVYARPQWVAHTRSERRGRA